MLPDRFELLSQVAGKLKNHEERLERLETLEFQNAALARGCIDWLDYDNSAFFSVDVPANPYPTGQYGWTHLGAWFAFRSTTAGNKTLHMTFNAIAANYSYHYKFSYGAVPTFGAGGGDGAAFMVVGNLYGSSHWTTGEVRVPMYPIPIDMGAFGWWEAYDVSRSSGSREERGDFSGRVTSGIARVSQLSFVPSADDIVGYVYLYGWCPTWDVAHGPPD